MKVLFRKSEILLMILLSIIFAKCDNINSPKIQPTVINRDLISINVDTLSIHNSTLASTIIKKITITPLETNEKYLIGKVNQIEIYNDTIYVLDSNVAKSIFVFNKNGKFIRVIGRIGKGPGEYIRPAMFALNKKSKSIFVLDRKSKRILEYKLSGEFVQSINLSSDYHINQIAVQEGNLFIDNLVKKNQKGEYWLYSINQKGDIMNRWFSVSDYNKGFVKPLTIASNFFQSSNDVKYVKPFFDTIFSISNNQVTPYIALSSENNIITEDVAKINISKNANELVSNFIDLKKFHGISRYFENSNLIHFEYRNNRLYHKLFYFKKNQRYICTTELVDDFINISPMERFMNEYQNQFVAVIQGTNLSKLLRNIEENRVKTDRKEIIKMTGVTYNSNPVIVFYECREEL